MRYLILFIIIFNVVSVSGQEQTPLTTTKEISNSMVEKQAQFPGGNIKINEFMSKNVHYPSEAIGAGLQGRVMVSFVIAETGDIKDIKVVKSVHKLLDDAAIEAVRKMPKWEPAVVDGKPIKSMYSLPVSFKLAE